MIKQKKLEDMILTFMLVLVNNEKKQK